MKPRVTVLDDAFVMFICPGCGQNHHLPIRGKVTGCATWEFNGDAVRPTLQPSILAKGVLGVYNKEGDWTGEWKKDANGGMIPYVCHSFVTAGRIQFLGDCTHEFANQTIDLPELEHP